MKTWQIAGVVLAGSILAVPGLSLALGFVRLFSIPAESMEPTLKVGSRLAARMGDVGELRRGDLVMVKQPDGVIYIKRIAALPGDRIAMANGVVILNGAPIEQRPDGEYRAPSEPAKPVNQLKEQFPGEAAPHSILDMGARPQDDTAEVMLPPDTYFLLGDNRDNSMDSRFPDFAGGGLGLVARNRIVGKYWFSYM